MKRKVTVFVLMAVVLVIFMTSCLSPQCVVPKTVLIDDTHDNSYNFDGYGVTAFYAKLSTVLQSMGYSVDFTSSAGFVPQNYGSFIVAAPTTVYSSAELQMVSAFLSKCNRKLILLGEWYGYYDNSPLNSILANLGSGISFNNNEISDAVNKYDNSSIWPIINNFITHPVTTGLNSIVLFAGDSINITGNAIALAYASSSAIVTAPSFVCGDSSCNTNSVDFEPDGIIPSIIAMAAESVLSGKIVAIGDASLFGNDLYGYPAFQDFIDVADNEQLLRNIISW